MEIVIVGHVDHGKSTLIGRLLYDTHSISSDQIEELKKASRNTENNMEFAFLLDHLSEEREQGITIDTTQTVIKTKKRELVIIDAPGHVEFVRNMVTGAARAECAILIIDAKEGVKEQTRRHAYILSLLGIKKLIVVINKMDLIDYDEERYRQVVTQAKEVLAALNLVADIFIPVSALAGENVTEKSTQMQWYEGESVLSCLEQLEMPHKNEGSTIYPVQDVYKINGKRIAVGMVEEGSLSVGDEIVIAQTMQRTQIASIEKFGQTCSCAQEGEAIGITTNDAVYLERGSIICNKEDNLTKTNRFYASVFWMENMPLSIDEKIIIQCSRQQMTGTVKQILSKQNTATLENEEMNLEKINYLDAAEVLIEMKNPLILSECSKQISLGRFVIIRDMKICGGGIINRF